MGIHRHGAGAARERRKRDRQNVEFKNNLAISYAKLAELSGEQNDKLKAREYYRQAESLWVELVQAAPQYAQFQNFLSLICERLADLE